jgi:hypothetical protein
MAMASSPMRASIPEAIPVITMVLPRSILSSGGGGEHAAVLADHIGESRFLRRLQFYSERGAVRKWLAD